MSTPIPTGRRGDRLMLASNRHSSWRAPSRDRRTLPNFRCGVLRSLKNWISHRSWDVSWCTACCEDTKPRNPTLRAPILNGAPAQSHSFSSECCYAALGSPGALRHSSDSSRSWWPMGGRIPTGVSLHASGGCFVQRTGRRGGGTRG